MMNRRTLLLDALMDLDRLISISRQLNNGTNDTIVSLRLQYQKELDELNEQVRLESQQKKSTCIHKDFIKYTSKEGTVYECTSCGLVVGELPLGTSVSKVIDR